MGGKIFGIFGLIAQCAAVCFWTYEAGTAAWLAATDPEHRQHLAASILLITTSAAIAAGTAYCLYRQFKWAQENKRFTAWLVANAEKIRTNQLAYDRSQRITLDTELVRHHLVFSALILSCRMQTRWIIKGSEPRFWHAFAATLYTFFYGWWGFPFGIFWTPVALIKNLLGSTSVRVSELLRPAPAKPVGFNERFQSGFSHRLHTGFFVDEKPAGFLFPPKRRRCSFDGNSSSLMCDRTIAPTTPFIWVTINLICWSDLSRSVEAARRSREIIIGSVFIIIALKTCHIASIRRRSGVCLA